MTTVLNCPLVSIVRTHYESRKKKVSYPLRQMWVHATKKDALNSMIQLATHSFSQ